MRTDAKIGFAIGAVLLAVLTVYAIVVPKKRTASPNGVAIVVPKGVSNTSPSTPSNGVVLTDKTPEVPPASLTDTPPMPAAPDAKSAPTPAAPDPSLATAKTADGVDWGKLIGTPSTTSTPSGTGLPNTLYSATPTGSNMPPVADTASASTGAASTSVLPPASDAQTFRPGTTGAVGPSMTSKIGTASHTRSNFDRKPSRSHGSESTDVANSASHGSEQYVVEAGDTLSGIAAAHYGAAHYYTQIIKANPSIDPNRMRPGTKLSLPDLSSAIAAAKNSETAVADMESPRTSVRIADGAAGGGVFTPGTSADTLFAASSNSPTDSGGTYIVHGGDNLYRISKKLYGTSKMAHEIFAANQSEIGPDMSKLKLGMVLTLPEAPTN